MSTSILVTGGTGTLGSHVVPRLLTSGNDVRVLSREPREGDGEIQFVTGDLASGKGIDAAMDGIETILHLAGSAKGDEIKARNMVQAATRAGVRHIVYISVVGADRIPVRSAVDRGMFGYFGSKLAAERIIADSGIPWTTLRATQFHDLTFKTVEAMAKMPVIPVPSGVRFQPIEAGEVAERLVELTLGDPAGLVPDMGGPQVYEMSTLVKGFLHAANKKRPIMPMPMPGAAARAVRAGANLTPQRAVGRRTWEGFLADRLGSADVEPVASPA